MASASVVVGNPKAASRTLTVAREVMSQLTGLLGDASSVLEIDLADHARGMFDWGDAELTALTAEVAQCRLLVAASPTYKATYTGLLKAFFDRYGNDGFRGVVAVPVMGGGGARLYP